MLIEDQRPSGSTPYLVSEPSGQSPCPLSPCEEDSDAITGGRTGVSVAAGAGPGRGIPVSETVTEPEPEPGSADPADGCSGGGSSRGSPDRVTDMSAGGGGGRGASDIGGLSAASTEMERRRFTSSGSAPPAEDGGGVCRYTRTDRVTVRSPLTGQVTAQGRGEVITRVRSRYCSFGKRTRIVQSQSRCYLKRDS